MTGRTVEAKEAEQMGMVSHIVEEQDLMPSALNTARTLVEKSPLGLQMTKETLHLNLTAPTLEHAIELENRNQSICCCAADFLEGVLSFGKKNRP